MNKAVIDVVNLTKKFGNQTLFESLNFQVQSGSTLVILGHSGCGKTTLLRILGGFEKASHGHVFIDGKSITGPSQKAIMVSQGYDQLFPWKTVLDNVVWPIMITKTAQTKDNASKVAKKYLSDLQIKSSDFNKFPVQLSGGMKQRAVIARSLALQPKLLLLDEPFGSLDDLTRANAQNIVVEACQKNRVTTILVTHSITEAIKMADHILLFCPDQTVKLIKNGSNARKTIENALEIGY